MSDQPTACARVSGSVVGEKPNGASNPETVEQRKEMTVMTARVGQKAPDFQAPAYFQGKFTNIKLSDHLGKWVLLCFYPGDFTFV